MPSMHALENMREQIRNNVPRRIVGTLSDHVHICVDASFEDGKYSGLGGALFDSSGRAIAFELSPLFLQQVKGNERVSIIQELEM